MKNESIPRAACQFQTSDVAIEHEGDDKSAKFRMVARSGQPIDHWFFGRVVHDMDGMFIANGKNRVAIDYAHGEEGIGFANHIGPDEEHNLVASGALTPFREDDRASEVIHKSSQGVPYEASINFGGTGLKMQQVGENESTRVNGYEFEGPGVVVREWPLRGIAVCLYGADQNTSTEFSEDDKVPVTFLENEDMPKEQVFSKAVELLEQAAVTAEPEAEEMEEQQLTDEAEATEAVEAEADEDTVEDATPEAEVVATVDTELSQRKAAGKKFTDKFGMDKGAEYFTLGLSYEEAMERHFTELTEENERLKLAQQVGGGDDALSFSEHKEPKKPKRPAVNVPEQFQDN